MNFSTYRLFQFTTIKKFLTSNWKKTKFSSTYIRACLCHINLVLHGHHEASSSRSMDHHWRGKRFKISNLHNFWFMCNQRATTASPLSVILNLLVNSRAFYKREGDSTVRFYELQKARSIGSLYKCPIKNTTERSMWFKKQETRAIGSIRLSFMHVLL